MGHFHPSVAFQDVLRTLWLGSELLPKPLRSIRIFQDVGVHHVSLDPGKLREIGVGYKVVGGHTFLYVGGIWMDTLYEPGTMRDKVIKVEAFSKAYFDLLKSQKDLGKLLTVGSDCIVCLGGKAYHVFSKLEEKKAEGKK